MKRLLLLGVSASCLLLTACPSTGIVCQTGTDRCGNGCVDLTTDSRNCGMCGQACFAGQICAGSQCQCRQGTKLCSGSCVVTASDPKFCGGCDPSNACATGQVCEAGQCRTDCVTGTRCGFSCVNFATDALNCGACGVTCPDSQSCHAGQCQWDLVAACFSTGQVVGVQSGSDLKGPVQPLGSAPLSLAQYGNVLLAADGYDDRLYQARLPALTQLSELNALGRAPNQVITDSTFVYVVNAVGHTVQVLRPTGDAGCPPVMQPDAGCAYAAFDDGGSVRPLGADGGCFYPDPNAADAGCADTRLEDAGVGPLPLDDGGCFAAPPPPPPPAMPCSQNADAGVTLLTVGELDTGANSFPQGVVKASGALWVPLYGGFGSDFAAGQKVLKIDVTNPSNPHTVATVDLTTLDLHVFDGGSSIARPYAIIEHGGKLYVTLNNYDDSYVPAGPGLLAVIDPTTLATSVIDLGGSVCLNPVCAIADGERLFVSCAGAAVYHPPEYYLLSTDRSAVVMYDLATGRKASWTPACPEGDDGGCMPILPSRLAVRDGRVYLGDQNGGRIFVADITADGGLVERRGYGAGVRGGPIQACGISPTINASNVADIVSLP